MRRLLITLLIVVFSPFATAQTVVVVSKSSGISALEYQHVANIFLARTSRFPNGEKAQPIELKDDALRTLFYQAISGKTPRQLHAYWTTLVFTGKGKPPQGIGNTDELVQKMHEHPGSITYLPLEQVTEEMKIVYSFP